MNTSMSVGMGIKATLEQSLSRKVDLSVFWLVHCHMWK